MKKASGSYFMFMLFPASVSAEVLGYEATLDTYTKEKKHLSSFRSMMGREIQ